MTRYRKIRKWGDSYVIRITSQDQLDLDVDINDEIDISDFVKKPKE